MKAFILAGGQGSRTSNPKLPKVLTQIDGVELLNIQLLELMLIEEVSQITLLLGHGADQVIEHLGKFLEVNPSKKYVDYLVESEPLGSAGMLSKVFSNLDNEICFIALGDILPRGGIIECFYVRKTTCDDKENIVFVHPNNHPNDSDSIKRFTDSQYVDEIIARSKSLNSIRENLSPVGFFFLNSADSKSWPTKNKIDLVQDVLPALLESRTIITAKNILRRSLDIGTPERLNLIQSTLAKVDMILDWVVFIDRDDTLIMDPTTPVNKGRDLELIDGVIPFLKFLNDTGIPVICISNQPAIAKGQSLVQDVEAQNREIQALLAKEYIYIDKWLYCPHHPEKGFKSEVRKLKVLCNCRKPFAGMIQDIKFHHDIDVSKSIIIGDTFRDIEIKADLAMRIHLSPGGNCDIITKHTCLENFEQIKSVVAKYAEGSVKSDYC